MGVFNLLLCNASVTRFLFLLSSYYYYCYYNGLRDVFQRHPYACKQASQPTAHFKSTPQSTSKCLIRYCLL